jgi:hypothetical protein
MNCFVHMIKLSALFAAFTKEQKIPSFLKQLYFCL